MDKIDTGFLSWAKTIEVYNATPIESVTWEAQSGPLLHAIHAVVSADDYFDKIAALWSQEPSKTSPTLSIRMENYRYIKHMGRLTSISTLSDTS